MPQTQLRSQQTALERVHQVQQAGAEDLRHFFEVSSMMTQQDLDRWDQSYYRAQQASWFDARSDRFWGHARQNIGIFVTRTSLRSD